MQKNKLNVIKISNNETCFSFNSKNCLSCKKKSCDNWINLPEHNNCSIVAAKNGPHTLEYIGKIYGLTRMRICQLIKKTTQKIHENNIEILNQIKH